jgi:YggT family protein
VIGFLISLIQIVSLAFTLGLLIFILMAFFVSPFHPLREALGRFYEPLLAPIRRFLPTLGGLDFSPLVLLILVNFIERVLIGFLVSLGP